MVARKKRMKVKIVKWCPRQKWQPMILQPEMSAEEVADEAIKAINNESYALIVSELCECRYGRSYRN